MESLFLSLANTEGLNIVEEDINKLASEMMVDTMLNLKEVVFVLVIEDKVVKSVDYCNDG